MVKVVVELLMAAMTETVTTQVLNVGGVALAGMVPPLKLMVPAPAVAVNVPPQLLVVTDGVAITRPAGRLSVKAAPAYGLPEGFCRVMVNVEVSPTPTVVGENPLVKAIPVIPRLAGAMTTFLAPSLVVSAPIGMVLVTVPVERPIPAKTGTTSVQVLSVGGVALAGMVPPLKLISALPDVAVRVPPQLLTGAGDAAIVRPAGRVSLTATPVKGKPLGFCKVMVSRLVLPGAIGDAPKDLIRLMDCTVKFALTAALVAPCVVVSAFSGMVLVKVPEEVLCGAVTRTVIRQVP